MMDLHTLKVDILSILALSPVYFIFSVVDIFFLFYQRNQNTYLFIYNFFQQLLNYNYFEINNYLEKQIIEHNIL